MHMSPLAKDKNVPQYALVVIDIFSKLADVIPMEERDGEHVLKAMRARKNRVIRCPCILMTMARLQLKIKFRISSTVKE